MFIRYPKGGQLLPNDVELEDGWRRHDGVGNVLSEQDRPIILLRDGTIFRPVSSLPNKWTVFYDMCRSQWKGEDPDYFDIIAYRVIE